MMVYDVGAAAPVYTGPAAIIEQQARRSGIPAYIPLTIAEWESGLNPAAVGDAGTSFGLFQLHRGGLAPSSLSDAQLKDPAVNASVAIPHMTSAYRRGTSMGLSGYALVEYVANNSGWPGSLGVDWTRRNRPDYGSGLRTAYQKVTAGEIGDGSGSAGSTGSAARPVYSPGSFFRAVEDAGKVESYDDWKDDNGGMFSNPFSYMVDQGKGVLFRSVLVLVGLGVILLAFANIMKVPATESQIES